MHGETSDQQLIKPPLESWGQGVREKARVFETLNFFGKGLTQIETDVQLL